MNIRRWITILFCVLFAAVPLILSSCIFSGSSGTGDGSVIEVRRAEEAKQEELTEEEFESLLENEDFLETFDTFYYPDSSISEVKAVMEEQDIVYVVLETDGTFDAVEDYYRNKKVQSIWSRDFIYQKSMAEVEEEFIEREAGDIPISKFTFSSKDRDRVVDVLVKELAADRTQIMITYWNLQ